MNNSISVNILISRGRSNTLTAVDYQIHQRRRLNNDVDGKVLERRRSNNYVGDKKY